MWVSVRAHHLLVPMLRVCMCVCVRHTESSVLLGGLWRAAKIILLKTGHHQDYCVVSSRIRRPAGFLKHLRVPS